MKKLYSADIYHKRFSPKIHEFFYTGFYIKFDIDEVVLLKSKIFSLNHFNIFSFYNKDHGHRDGSSLREWAGGILKTSGFKDFKGEILLQTFPRVLGYVFNPVSFWYCYEASKLIAVICEVNNTFGETHSYVIKNPKDKVYSLPKEFHVSPFFDIKGQYYFDFTKDDKAVICLKYNNNVQILTSIKGQELQWSDKNLIKLFFKFPIYSIIIMMRIHYQALCLFFKKIKFFTKPEKIKKEVTYE